MIWNFNLERSPSWSMAPPWKGGLAQAIASSNLALSASTTPHPPYSIVPLLIKYQNSGEIVEVEKGEAEWSLDVYYVLHLLSLVRSRPRLLI